MLGMFLYCVIFAVEIIMALHGGGCSNSDRYCVVTKIFKHLVYLGTVCWLNAVFFVMVKRQYQLRPPKIDNRKKIYGFGNAQFKKSLIHTIGTPILTCVSTISIYFLINKENASFVNPLNNAFKKSLFYPTLFFQIISGILINANIIFLVIFIWVMEKSRRRINNGISTWTKIPRSLRSTIK